MVMECGVKDGTTKYLVWGGSAFSCSDRSAKKFVVVPSFEYELALNENKLKFGKESTDENEVEIGLGEGVLYGGKNIAPKLLGHVEAQNLEEKTIKFSGVLPGIYVDSIEPFLKKIKIEAQFTNSLKDLGENIGVYARLYIKCTESNNCNGAVDEKIIVSTKSVEEDGLIEWNNLEMGREYEAQFFIGEKVEQCDEEGEKCTCNVDTNDGASCVEYLTALYKTEDGKPALYENIKTREKIDVAVDSLRYWSSATWSDQDGDDGNRKVNVERNLGFRYKLRFLDEGIDKLEYYIVGESGGGEWRSDAITLINRNDDEEKGYININNIITNKKDEKYGYYDKELNIGIPSGMSAEDGKNRYKICMDIYSKQDENLGHECSEEAEFVLQTPTVSIASTQENSVGQESSKKINFSVYILDPDYVIKNGEYKIEIVKLKCGDEPIECEDDETPIDYKEKKYSIYKDELDNGNLVNKISDFEFNGESSSDYAFRVIYECDDKNPINIPEDGNKKEYKFSIANYYNVHPHAIISNGSLQLLFSMDDSLIGINKMNYVVSGGIYSNVVGKDIATEDIGTKTINGIEYKYIDLGERITDTTKTYYIQIQLLQDNNKIYDTFAKYSPGDSQ